MHSIQHYVEHYKKFLAAVEKVKDNYTRLRNDEAVKVDGFRANYNKLRIQNQIHILLVNLKAQLKVLDIVRTAMASFITESLEVYQGLFKNKSEIIEKVMQSEDELPTIAGWMKMRVTDVQELFRGIRDQEIVFRNYLFKTNQTLQDMQILLERAYYGTKHKVDAIAHLTPERLMAQRAGTPNTGNIDIIKRKFAIFDKDLIEADQVQDIIINIQENQAMLQNEKATIKTIVDRIRIPVSEGLKNAAVKSPGFLAFNLVASYLAISYVNILGVLGWTLVIFTANAAIVKEDERFNKY